MTWQSKLWQVQKNQLVKWKPREKDVDVIINASIMTIFMLRYLSPTLLFTALSTSGHFSL